jgi:hypothetical protein
MSEKVCIYVSLSHQYYYLETGSKPLMKGPKLTKIKKTDLIEVDDSNELLNLSTLSYLDNSQGNRLRGSDDEDKKDDDGDDDVAQMIFTEAKRMFDNEVTLSCLLIST